MNDPVMVRVFPRLECCVPDFTGKNAALAGILHQVKQEVSDLAKIEVVPNTTSAERIIYYEQMIDALLAGGYELPFLEGAREWGALRREHSALKTRSFYSSGILKRSREIGFFLFSITPVIAINGKAVFVGKVPSADQLIEAIRSSL
ncbi:MAG: hypothetical protein AB1556_09450 [Bacillota bacterium]